MAAAGEGATEGKDREAHGRDAAARLFAGPGEVRAHGRAIDWGATPLGWPDGWSPALRIATRAMLDAPHPICLWSGPEYALVYNDAYRRILSAKHPAALGCPGSEVWAEIWAELAPQFAQVWAGGPPVYGEDARFVMARLEGGGTEDAWFSYSLSALRDEDGQIVAVLNISPETTARVRAEQAISAQREAAELASRRLAFLADASQRLAASLDYETTLDEILALAVPAVADWALYTVDAGDGTLRIVASRHADSAKEAFIAETARRYPIRADEPAGAARALRTGESELIPEVPDAVLAAVARDAEHLELLRAVGFRSLMTVPVSAGGRVLGALGFVTGESARLYGSEDLTLAQELARRAGTALEQARLYAEAERRREEAEAANSAKSQFLSTMSHELRTPLNAIGGYTDLLTLGLRGPLSDAQRQDLERVRLANQYLMSLVTDILNFVRVDAGQIEFRLADVELASVVSDLESLLGPQLQGKGIAFDHGACASDTPDCPHVVRADPEKLRQILLNLLGNAVKFTPTGGRVALACETDRAAKVIRVRVRDTGRGIPADQLERIFEPFVQVDRHRTHESQQGVGLGLAISRELARGMGGDLTAESTVGVGSTFTLILPAA